MGDLAPVQRSAVRQPPRLSEMHQSLSIDTSFTPWLEEARKLIGLKEIPGHNDEQEIMALYRDVGHKWVEHDEVPWCAAAVGATLKRAGLKFLPTLRARDYERYGIKLEQPVLGCIVTFWRQSQSSGKGHVGFYGGIENGKVWVLGGNQSNTFCWKQYNLDQVTGYSWPVTISGTTPKKATVAQHPVITAAEPLEEPQGGSVLDLTGRNWKTAVGAVVYIAGSVLDAFGVPMLDNQAGAALATSLQQTGAFLAGTGLIHKLDRGLRFSKPILRLILKRL